MITSAAVFFRVHVPLCTALYNWHLDYRFRPKSQ